MDINEQIEALKAAQKRRQQALAWYESGEKSLKEIGAALGVTRERARQLVAAAIKEKAK